MKQTDQRIFALSSFSNAFLFLVLTLLWSWTFLVIAILRGEDANIFPTSLFRLLANLGPLIIAVGMMKFRPDGESLYSYWQRLIHWRNIPRWILIVSLLFPLLVAIIASLTSQTSLVSIYHSFKNWKTDTEPFSIVWTWILPFFYAILPEELGWRGYALPRLQSRWNPLFSSVSLGIVWCLWYLPLFFIPGTYLYHLNFGSALFWIFLFNVLSQSIILTALINGAKGYLLPTLFFHYISNLTSEIRQPATLITAHGTFWTFCAACLIVIYWLFTKQVNFHRSHKA